jgi:hypothetical protein
MGEAVLMDYILQPRDGNNVAALIDGFESTLKVHSLLEFVPVGNGQCQIDIFSCPAGFYPMGMKKQQVACRCSDQEKLQFRCCRTYIRHQLRQVNQDGVLATCQVE